MRRDGFTLLEIVVVVALIGLLMVALTPRLGGGMSRRLENAVDQIEADLRYAGQRAVATGKLHRWTVDLDEQLYRVEVAVPIEPAEEPTLPTHAELLDLAPPDLSVDYTGVSDGTGRWRWLGEAGIVIDAVRIGDESFAEGAVSVAFSGDGGADPAQVVLTDTEYEYTSGLRVLAFTGEVRRIENLEEP